MCHVLPEAMPPNAGIPAWIESQVPNQSEARRHSREALDKRVVDLSKGGVTQVEAFVEEGDDHAAIVKRAEAFAADLVVVGSHGRTGITRILLGSVAERIIRHAHCAVLVARKGPASGPVVTSTDLSDAAKPGLRAAAIEAARTGSSLVAIHVFDLAWPGATPYAVDASGLSAVLSDTEAIRSATTQLNETLEEATRGLLVHWKGEVLVGDPATLIVRRAEELQARLVAVATHGRTGLSRILLGSVAEKIVRHAHTSVLVVRGETPPAS